MHELSFSLLTSFAGPALGAVVMAILLRGFAQQYRKIYLYHWSLGWAALAAYGLARASLAAKAPLQGPAPSTPANVILSVAAGMSSFLAIGWLLFGVHELVRRRHVRLRESRRILLTLLFIGAITSVLFLNHPEARGILRIGSRTVAAAIGFSWASFTLWSARRRERGMGYPVLSAGFALSALLQVHTLFIAIRTSGGNLPRFLAPLASIDGVMQIIMGVGMVACLLEDEREASDLATVEIEHLAYHDALTGLPNRPLFVDRLILALAQANRTNQKVAVFFLDLDRFKDINDSLGHTIGDLLLKAVAERIRRCVREGDTIARFGGDEFTLLLPRVEKIEDAAKIAQKILETLKIPFLLAEQELFATTSIGISIYPNDGLDAGTLVRNADTAMYRAKEQGRDNFQLYAPTMNARALERLALENMLRKALANDELVVFYQPLIDLKTRNIIGVEALVRWQHPELGLLSPAHFISVAEVSGLIIPLGNWILRTACRHLKQWHKRIDDSLTVSVNLSARQFQQPDLVEQIGLALRDTGLSPGFLELEITESNAMQNAENTIHTLRELKATGVRIAMDDFGTGYSSLNYLKRFPIDTLKLDQSFVREVTTDRSDAAIVSAVIAMAHSLNLTVVAEGVETEEQFEFLENERCDRIQGYLFSVPLSAEELERFLLDGQLLESGITRSAPQRAPA